MPTWNPQQYLKFAEARTRPSRDLAARIDLPGARRVIDLGCGPGNSAEALSERWPNAEITGLDSSASMIDAARAASPRHIWRTGDIAQWASTDGEPYDVAFSSAALQWVDDHATVFPRMLARVAGGGALAVQMPGNYLGAQYQLMRTVAERHRLKVREWHSNELDFYYDTLAPHALRLDFWVTDYLHILPNLEAIVEWYKGTGMRPYLDALPDETARQRFTAEYLEGLRDIYTPRPDGAVLFPFRRIFIIAYSNPAR